MSEPIVKGTISLYPIPSMLHMSVVNGALYRYFNNREDLSGTAARLQELLNSLKNERDENNEIWQEVEKRINTYLGYSVNNLFRRSGRHGWQTGRLLEHEFAGLFQALCDMCLGQDTSRAEYTWTKDKKGKKKHRTIKNTAYTGNIKGTVQLDSDFDVDGIFNNIQNAWTRENIQMALQNSNITKNTMAGWVKPPEPKDIKTDIYGGDGNISNTTILEWKADKKLIDLLYILNNYKISLKNYSDLNNITLGKSTPFKAYAGVLQTLGYSDSVIRESYIRLQCCYINSVSMTDSSSKHQNHQKYISTVMSKIKSVFELIGMGIVSADGFQDNVQLFVVNQHNGNFIKVYDTTTLAKSFLKNNNFSIIGNNPFAKQKITISVK